MVWPWSCRELGLVSRSTHAGVCGLGVQSRLRGYIVDSVLSCPTCSFKYSPLPTTSTILLATRLIDLNPVEPIGSFFFVGAPGQHFLCSKFGFRSFYMALGGQNVVPRFFVASRGNCGLFCCLFSGDLSSQGISRLFPQGGGCV